MDKAHVYYGPDHGFEKYVEKYVDVNECMDFSEFIRRCDERSRKHVFHVKGQEEDEALDDDDDSLRNVNLIVSSDEYATVRDHVILNFDGFLSSHNVKTIFVQNPPLGIAKKLEFLYSEHQVEHFQYPTINKELLLSIFRSFADEIIGQSKACQSLLTARIH